MLIAEPEERVEMRDRVHEEETQGEPQTSEKGVWVSPAPAREREKEDDEEEEEK